MRARSRSLVFAVIVGALALTWLAGCSTETRDKIMPYLFDGFSDAARKPRPPTQRVRRELLQEVDQLKRELADARAAAAAHKPPPEQTRPAVEQAKQWEEASQLLPKDRSGRVDWVQALKAGTVAPRPAIDPTKPGYAPLDFDVDLTPPGSRTFTVKYPHAPHTEWLTCANCHPAIFPLKRQATPILITMAKIRKGEYCGACHGKVAFGVDGECARCHAKVPAKAKWRPTEEPRTPIERAATWEEAQKLLPVAAGGGPDWAKALAEGVIAPRPGIDPKAEDNPVFPLDVELVPADAPTFKVVFPHKVHTAMLSCATCHPAIFQMAAGADPITMEKIFGGEYCGRCHGKVAFMPATACGRCHPLIAGGG